MTPARLALVALATAAIACSSGDDPAPVATPVHISVSSGPDNSGRGVVRASGVLLCQFVGTVTTGVCSTTLERDSVSVDLVAVPDEGSSFIGWSGDCSGFMTCRLSLADSHAVQAAFFINSRVTVRNAAGSTGVVRVTSSPAGIDCTLTPQFVGGVGPSCGASFPARTSMTLTATPDEYSSFDGWSGGCTGTTCTQTIDKSVTFVASSQGSFPLTILVSEDDVGSGTITSSPAGMDCTVTAGVTSGACTATFTGGTMVTLHATPAAGSAFAYWIGLEDDRGGCTTDPTCVVTIDGARGMPATFYLVPGLRGAASR